MLSFRRRIMMMAGEVLEKLSGWFRSVGWFRNNAW